MPKFAFTHKLNRAYIHIKSSWDAGPVASLGYTELSLNKIAEEDMKQKSYQIVQKKSYPQGLNFNPRKEKVSN